MKRLLLVILTIGVGLTQLLSADKMPTMNFDKETRSLIRKMHVYKDPSWVCKVVNKKAEAFYFVSPKSMFEFYFNPEKWPDAHIEKSSEIKELLVTDYATLKPIDAKTAYYVYGSNKVSLAGDDLPAFKHFNQAQLYMEKHNGRRILHFKEVKKGLIQLLNGDI